MRVSYMRGILGHEILKEKMNAVRMKPGGGRVV
jgi:hypothetical protein